jgi:hypothetical protein
MQPCWQNPLPMAMQQHGGRVKSIDVRAADGDEIPSGPVPPYPESAPSLAIDPQYQSVVSRER